jgi:hypothetical protein
MLVPWVQNGLPPKLSNLLELCANQGSRKIPNVPTQRLRSLVEEIWTRAMLFLHLLNGMNSSPKASELSEFLLDFEQSLLPLAMSKMGLRILPLFTSILLIQFLKLCDFGPKTCNLFPKNFEVLHRSRIALKRSMLLPMPSSVRKNAWS